MHGAGWTPPQEEGEEEGEARQQALNERAGRCMRESFVLVTELTPRDADWTQAMAQAEGLARSLEPRLRLTPRIRLASLPAHLPDGRNGSDSSSRHDLASVLAEEAAAEGEVFVLPAMLDFSLVQKARLAELVAGTRL